MNLSEIIGTKTKNTKRKRIRKYLTFRKYNPNNPPKFTDTPVQVPRFRDFLGRA